MPRVLPRTTETDVAPSDEDIIGGGGGPDDPGDEWRDRYPDPHATPLSVYRVATTWIVVWIVIFFSTLTAVVRARWVNSDDWVSVPLPHVLYLNTAILLLSSLTLEFARRSLRTRGSKYCIRWLLATFVLGLIFLGGQILAWRELVQERLYVASNPGSFFIYVISATHGLHLLGGITVLGFVSFFLNRWQKIKQASALSAMALYWHFMDGLWMYLLALLFITIEK